MSINTRLLKHCKNSEEREEVKRLFKRNHRILSILVSVIEEDLDRSYKEFKAEVNYNKYNWDKYIVDKLSEQRTLEYVLNLVKSSFTET